jgi:predicted nucleotidyltransferase
MKLDLDEHTIFVTLAGSQAHGTAHSDSDVDLRGVCIAPLELRLSLFDTFEQFEGTLQGSLWTSIHARLAAHPTAARALGAKTESVIFDVAKFLRLCADANPNALEILFADEHDWVFETAVWRQLHRERHHFLSKRVQQTYLRYAIAQLKKIKLHRARPAEPAKRNAKRAALEQRYGYDTKHAMHLLRLMQTGLELLKTGELRVRRPDADQLNAVREGSLSFDQLLQRAADLETEMREAAERSPLPEQIDHAFVDDLAFKLMRGITDSS